MPYCIPDTTPVCARVDLLHQYAIEGTRSYSIERFMTLVAHRAQYRWRINGNRGNYKRILAEESLAQVHQLPYVADPPDRDCYRDVDTTAQRGGECKALNILLVSLLMRLGITAEVVWIMQPGKPLNHVSSVVWLDGKPLWADASIRGARLGESPYDALERTQAWHVVGGKV